MSPTSEVAIATRANAGLLRANAALLIFQKSERLIDSRVPPVFWWAKGYQALTQNWELGDFETWVDKKFHLQAFGVRFHRDDLDLMLGPPSSVGKPAAPAKEAGGRPMSPLWPEWVAELASLVHEEGIPDNQTVDELIARVADSLMKRGLEGPGRTTLQETARAVVRRLRPAGN